MKKLYFLLMVFLVTVSGSLYAQKSLVDEGFESSQSGALPTGWTQSREDAAKKWAVEVDLGTNLFDPANCATGKGRVKFVGNSETAAKANVMLISPVFNTQVLAEPILVFDYASIRPTGSSVVDTLKVYYRLRQDREWVLVRSLGEADRWTRDTVAFTSKTTSFQFAFECVDNGARGAAIDNVRLTSRPVCKAVTGIEVYNKIHSEAKLRWSGSLSAEYNVVFATQLLTDPANAVESDGLFARQKVSYLTNTTIKGLTASTTYYYYIQSDCGDGDVSDWVSGEFTSACNPVQNFSTSFDSADDIACWTTIGENHGWYVATRPTNKPTSVMDGRDSETNEPIFYEDPQTTAPIAHSGASALFMPAKSYDKENYSRVFAVSPRLADDVDLKTMQMTFWVRTNTKQLHLRLLVSEWPDDFTNAQESGEIVLKTTYTYERFTVSFEDITSNGKYIAFKIDGSEEVLISPQFPAINIDDVVLEAIGACTAASKVVMFNDPKLTETTAALRWNRNGAAKFNVKVSNSDFNPAADRGNVYNDTIDQPQLDLKDLVVGSRYFYYVQPICTDGTVGTWSNTQMFQTECSFDGVSIPFKENFDKSSDPSVSKFPLPVCWNTIIPDGTGEGYRPAVSRSDDAYSKYFNIMSTCQGETYIILPKVNAKVAECQLRFFYAISSKAIPVEVGVLSDISNVGTFEKIESFTADNKTSGRAWQEALVRFDAYQGNGQYIALHYSAASVTFYFDNFVVEERAACATPADIRSLGATANSIIMEWKASGDEETEWDVAYTLKGADMATATIISGVNEHPYTITELDENTIYDVYVRSVCSADAKGAWAGPTVVKTISPATLPYSCNFEEGAVAGAWSLLNGVQENQWIVGDALKDLIIDGAKVGKSLYISSDYGMTCRPQAKDTWSYATRLLDLEAGLIDFEFDWRMPGANQEKTDWYGNPVKGTNGIIIPFLVPENITINGGVAGNLYYLQSRIHFSTSQAVDWNKSMPEGWIRLCDGFGYLANQTDEWQHHKYSYPLLQSGRYNLVFFYMVPSTYYLNLDTDAAAVDNVAVKVNTADCIAPVRLETFDVAQYSAKVRFLNYNATEWKVVVADTSMTVADLDNATSSTEHVVYAGAQTTNPISITGLQPETQYYAYVRPSCGDAADWASISFRTICPSQDVPVAFTFDEEELSETDFKVEEIYDWKTGEMRNETIYVKLRNFMDCWRRIPEECDNMDLYPMVNNSSVLTYKFSDISDLVTTNATQMLLLSTGSYDNPDKIPSTVASPEMSRDVKELMVSFRALSEYDYAKYPMTLEVGVMTDPLNLETFELVETITPMYGGKWNTYYVFFNEYEGVGRHIALRVPAIGNMPAQIFIDDLKIDEFTGCIPVRDVNVTDITATAATVQWRDLANVGKYHVKVSSAPMGRWEDKGNVYDGIVEGETSLNLTDLRSNKLYYVYVRSICNEEGEYSIGMGECRFRSGCANEMVLPFYEDFDSYEVGSMPDCWYVMQNKPDGGSNLKEFSVTTNSGVTYKSLGRLSMELKTGNENLFPAMVAMPAVPDAIQNFAVSFKALQLLTSDKLIVGVVADINDPETFVAVDTVNCVAVEKWEDYTVDFSNYVGEGRNIAFYLPSAKITVAQFYIDNVLIRHNAMDCPDATAPLVLNITSTSASINWADNNAAKEFEIKVSTDEINPEVEEGNVLVATAIDGLYYELTGLTPATTYYVYVRIVCGKDAAGYWSAATPFITACSEPQAIPYYEDFTSYGGIADNGFFPICWRNRVISYGTISPDVQPEPYIENASRPSLFMKAYYDAKDNSYAVVDAVTPVIEFGENGAGDYMMSLTYKSTVKDAPIYVGLMSDPSDATTFVAYDTIRPHAVNTWETNIVNFIYHQGSESHIAFRINSLDIVPEGYNYEESSSSAIIGYQVNITDIKVEPLDDCMPPYRVSADLRPNRAFITWVPGDKTSEEWKYYIADYQMNKLPFTDEEWNNYAEDQYSEFTVIDSTKAHTLVVNGLKDWTDYYLYLKSTGCDAFYPLMIDLSGRPSCGIVLTLDDMPIAPDFMNNGFGIGLEPQYSAYFDCWKRTDDIESDEVAYPYINNDGELYFRSEGEASSKALLPVLNVDNDTVLNETQLRFTAKASTSGAKLVVGFSGYYEDYSTWPSTMVYAYDKYQTIELTDEYQEYVVKLDTYKWTIHNDGGEYDPDYEKYGPYFTVEGGDMLINDINWEKIPHCFTPELVVKRHDDTSFDIEWNKIEGQKRWEVAFGTQGFDLESANWISRADTTYMVVNQTVGTPYEFYLRSLCDNGMTSEYGRICVTTDQVPAQYPYSSPLFYDATMIKADDGVFYAYRTIDMPAGPHSLTFDWKLSDNSDAFLRVFSVPATEMITADAPFSITKDGATPKGWTEVASLTGKSAWTSASHTMYVSLNNAAASHLLFAWSGAGPQVVKNVKVGDSNDCTVPEALVATNITSTSAILDWTSYNASAWDLNYWRTTEGRADFQTVMDVYPGYKLAGLDPNTQYTFEVSSQCKPQFYSEPYTFRTACEAMDGLNETFDNGEFDGCWSQYHGLFDEVVADGSKLIPVADVWEVTSIPMLESSGTKNARLTIEGDDRANWLVSPAVNLSENSALSFYLAFTTYNGKQDVTANGQMDDRFIVAVSTDEGQSWKAEDATIWDNAQNTNRILNRIGNRARRIYVDLTPYTGKTVRVAFYGESTIEFESNDIHIDSVTIDCVNAKQVKDDYCQGYTYERNGFSIDRDDLVVFGDHTFTRLEPTTTGGCDTLVTLYLDVKESMEYEYTRNICEGDVYTDNNFAGLKESNTYTKLLTAKNGCDSLIVLNLIVNASYELTRTLEIDDKELPYEYECQLFPVGTKSGKYDINCKTAANCDSIIHLTLTVNEGTAVDNVESTETIVLTPNPVKGGELITVDYDFSFDQIAGISIEVYNSVGQMVSVSTPQGKPVAFSAPQVAGVYTVRIITVDERVFIGRFIVR